LQAFRFYIANGFCVKRLHAPNFNVYGTETYRSEGSGFTEEKKTSARYDWVEFNTDTEFRTDPRAVPTRFCSRLAAVIVAVDKASAARLYLCVCVRGMGEGGVGARIVSDVT